MNVLHYDAVTLGNHEFNYGLPLLILVLRFGRVLGAVAKVSEEVGDDVGIFASGAFSRFRLLRRGLRHRRTAKNPHRLCRLMIVRHRAQRMRKELAQSSSVTRAIYNAGFNSSSRAYEGAQLGMTPARFASGGRGEQIGYAVASSPFPACSPRSRLPAARAAGRGRPESRAGPPRAGRARRQVFRASLSGFR